MIPNRIVLTGPPGSGKSSVIGWLSKYTNGKYIQVSEVARTWLELLNNEDLINNYSRDFIQDLIEVNQIKNFLQNQRAFFDRGLPDEIAYRNYFNIPITENLQVNCKKYYYDKIFFFPFWEEIYQNDEIRKETIDEALVLHTKIYDAYSLLGYEIIEVPKVSVQERVKFILSNI